MNDQELVYVSTEYGSWTLKTYSGQYVEAAELALHVMAHSMTDTLGPAGWIVQSGEICVRRANDGRENAYGYTAYIRNVDGRIECYPAVVPEPHRKNHGPTKYQWRIGTQEFRGGIEGEDE
jgi:hypothetical protein